MPDQVMPELPYFYASLSVVCASVANIKVQAGINAVINLITSGLFIGNADVTLPNPDGTCSTRGLVVLRYGFNNCGTTA